MKRLLYLILFILIIDLSFYKCANPGRPTGGPKDTIPPTLLIANPINGTTNFNGEEITLEFSEYINADKLRQQLIVTPKTDIIYKSVVKGNKLIIKLESELLDSTTYNFNFANGITDITEKNPVVNLSLAFSTGPYIDSMKVTGYVQELLTKKPGAKYVVGLYPFSDTLDYFSENPTYFTTANDSGRFILEYIKKGDYKILAFNDDNKNFLLDPETESHGFLEEILSLNEVLTVDTLRCVLQNIKPIKLINGRPVGPYVELKFNKLIDRYSISPEDLNHNIVGDDRDIIRIYKPELAQYRDSLSASVTAFDSLENSIVDTIKFVFIESNRKPSKFSYSFKSPTLVLLDSNEVELNFNKPIINYDETKLLFKSDSTFSYSFDKKNTWNFNKTQLKINFAISKDSLFNAYIASLPPDTTTYDSTQQKKSEPKISSISLVSEKGAFVSVENDTSSLKEITLTEERPKPSGSLKISLTTNHKSFIVQLIDEGGKVAYQKKNQLVTTFDSVKPDTYTIRILIDNNLDGEWSYGNLLKNEEPEEVFLYAEKYSIRENWVNEVGITF